MKKEVKNLVKMALAAGFTFNRQTGSGHYKLTHKGGSTIVIPSTPSGSRWKQNVLADIKRASRRGRK